MFLGDPTSVYHAGFRRSRILRSQGLCKGIVSRFECPETPGRPALLAENCALREWIALCGRTIILIRMRLLQQSLSYLMNETNRSDIHRVCPT